jgi:L-alanine-DL-glutamate epimerase-like enolase superfamily enzyme
MLLAEPVPELAWLVASSPLDAALHDAFGQANGICSYDGYGPDFMSHDLSRWLGDSFVDRYPRDYLSPAPVAHLPVFHLVGGVDKLAEAEVDDTDPADGLPVSLDQWIQRDGVYCLKVKLRGTDVPWDVERTQAVYTTAVATRRRLGFNERVYLSVDSNEMHSGPDAVVEYLERLRKTSPDAYDSLLYLEQPTERDLDAHSYDMRPVAALKPVIVDEGVTGTDSLARARSLGWSGIALKTCKGHSASLLYAAVAREYGMPVTVQDLTNPGLSFVHSAGLAARVSPIMGVEYNSRQYLPDASSDARSRHTGLFTTLDGQISTASISIRGLGY